MRCAKVTLEFFFSKFRLFFSVKDSLNIHLFFLDSKILIPKDNWNILFDKNLFRDVLISSVLIHMLDAFKIFCPIFFLFLFLTSPIHPSNTLSIICLPARASTWPEGHWPQTVKNLALVPYLFNFCLWFIHS